MKVRKILVISLIGSIMCFSNACVFPGGGGVITDDSSKKADERFQQIVEIINSRDMEAMKTVFSQKAIQDADDFNGNLDRLFVFIPDGINSWEKLDGPTVMTSNKYGHKKQEVDSFYSATTDNQKYFFLLDDFPSDDDNPDNVGLYLLLVVRAEDKEKIWDGANKIIYDGDKRLSHAGIYLPIQ